MQGDAIDDYALTVLPYINGARISLAGYARRTYSARTKPREQCIFRRDIGARANRATIFTATSEAARTGTSRTENDTDCASVRVFHQIRGEIQGSTPRNRRVRVSYGFYGSFVKSRVSVTDRTKSIAKACDECDLVESYRTLCHRSPPIGSDVINRRANRIGYGSFADFVYFVSCNVLRNLCNEINSLQQ